MRVKQDPIPPMEWLHDGAEDYTRVFAKSILRDESQPEWAQCTNEEKEQWEREHPQPTPEQPTEE